jgi:twitching motility protein PilT
MPYLDQFLQAIVAAGASDLHIGEGQPPKMRRHGDVMAMRPEPVLRDEAVLMLSEVAGPTNWKIFDERGDLDFAYEMDAASRFRCNFLKQSNGYGAVFRLIPTKIATLEELGIPTVAKEFGKLRGGLVLVTGPTGSGKSTTLAALIDYININFARHIVTVEEPIEFVHKNKRSIITQREVPGNTRSFPEAVRAALREDADVVLVGEMRDLETISLAITASETGHLVLGTLHTGTAARTLDRVLDVFPVDQQEQIRIMISESLRGVISQQLIPRADGTGRVLAIETLTNTPAVSNVIREARAFMLPGIIQTGRKQGMQLMDDALIDLRKQGLISAEEALARADQKEIVRQHIAK